MIDRDFITEVLAALVRIDSVNPAMEAGGPGEAAIATRIEELLGPLGLEVHRHEPEPGRVSVVGILRGAGGGRSLMLNAHSDTVGVAGMADPFSARVVDGRLYGRGAYDMKGALAACIGAARACAEGASLRGDLVIAAVADEEDASLGTRDLLGRYRVDGAVVTEPTSLDVCIAHKGFVWIEVVVHGRAAHGSRPDLGVDANLAAGRFLAGLAELERKLRERPAHPLLGTGSLHVARIEGGTGPSTYADRCRIQIERRTLPGETEAAATREIRALLDELAGGEPEFRYDLSVSLSRPPFEADPDAPIVRAAVASTREVLGREPALVGDSPWMDAALLAAAGVDTVVLGPAGAGAHAAEEWVDLESVHRLAEILVAIARRYAG